MRRRRVVTLQHCKRRPPSVGQLPDGRTAIAGQECAVGLGKLYKNQESLSGED